MGIPESPCALTIRKGRNAPTRCRIAQNPILCITDQVPRADSSSISSLLSSTANSRVYAAPSLHLSSIEQISAIQISSWWPSGWPRDSRKEMLVGREAGKLEGQHSRPLLHRGLGEFKTSSLQAVRRVYRLGTGLAILCTIHTALCVPLTWAPQE